MWNTNKKNLPQSADCIASVKLKRIIIKSNKNSQSKQYKTDYALTKQC